MIEGYLIHVLIMIGIYTILAVTLNLVLGYGGMLNLGHMAFFGVGAYSSVLLMDKLALPFIVAFIAAGILSSFCGALLVYASRKLKGDYLALATLGFAFIVTSLIYNWISLTNGAIGIVGVPRPTFLSFTLGTDILFGLFVLVVTVVALIVTIRVANSPFGRLLEALRDDEIGLRVLGKNTALLKIKAMVLAAFFAGLSGSLFAHYVQFIDPTIFTLHDIVYILTIIIIGGIASMKGSIFAAVGLWIFFEALKFIPFSPEILGPLRQLIYAALLIIILMYKPRGIFGRVDLQ